jgi:hypothetical protein
MGASSVLITHVLSGCGPVDYHLRPGLKKEMKVRDFLSDMQVIATTEIRLHAQKFEFLDAYILLSNELRNALTFMRSVLNKF